MVRTCACGMTSAEAYAATLRRAIEGAGPDSITGRMLSASLAELTDSPSPDHKPEEG